jgi:hypothetical protein
MEQVLLSRKNDSYRVLGLWTGEGVEETGQVLVRIDPTYFRPTEVDLLLGDPRKARTKLGWRHCTTFPELVAEMVAADMRFAALEKKGGKKAFHDVMRGTVFRVPPIRSARRIAVPHEQANPSKSYS